MTRFLIFLLSLSFWSSGQDGLYPHAPNLRTENLKGAVRSIEERSFIGIEENGVYVASTPKWKLSGRDSKSTFDSLGNLISIDRIRPGNSERTTGYIYKNGKLIESIDQYSRHVFEYDSMGKIAIEYYESRIYDFMRSENGAPFNKSLAMRIDYFYDDSGNLTIKKGIRPDSSNEVLDSIFYDEQNRPIELVSYDGDWMDLQEWFYDSFGNIQRLTLRTDLNELICEIYNSYENNQLIFKSEVNFIDDVPIEEWLTQFENGLESTAVFNNLGEITITQSSYEFDDNGNWIKKTIKASDDENVYVITRTIDYY